MTYNTHMAKRVFSEEHIRKLRESHIGNKGYWVGKKFSAEHREKLKVSHEGLNNSPATQFKKGLTPWNKGLAGYGAGKKNGVWKGDKVGYYALHAWVKRQLGKANQCSNCSSVKNIQWANASHEYKRVVEDWIQLCVFCHREYDRDFPGASRQYIASLSEIY